MNRKISYSKKSNLATVPNVQFKYFMFFIPPALDNIKYSYMRVCMCARESIDRLRDTGSLDLRLICSVFLRAPVFPVSVYVIHCQLPSSLSPTLSSAMLFFIFPFVSSFLLVTCTGVPFFLWSGHASEVYIDYRILIYTSVDNEGNGSPKKANIRVLSRYLGIFI